MKNSSTKINFFRMHPRSRDSVVRIVTALRAARFGVRIAAGQKEIFSSPIAHTGCLPIQPPVQWVPGSVSPGVMWPRLEADHSVPLRAEVKN